MNRWTFSTLKFILEGKEVTLLCCGCLTVFCARNTGMRRFCRLQSRMWLFWFICLFLFYFDCVEMLWRLLSSDDFLRFLYAGREWLGKQSLEFLLLKLYQQGWVRGNVARQHWDWIPWEWPGQSHLNSWARRFSNRSSTWMHWSQSRGVQKRAVLSPGRCESEMLQCRAQVRLSMLSFKELWKS